MLAFNLPTLYPITDRQRSGLSHAEQVEQLCEGGATLIQLREKHLPPREFYREATAAWHVARRRGVRLIINDRADVALALAAAGFDFVGVHLGQDDLPPEAARRVLGSNAIIGFSTHNLEQAILAAQLPVNYIALGPIFATSSKENPDPVVGLDGLRQVRARLARTLSPPLVAIGGINGHNAREVLAAGADAVAVLGALYTEDANIAGRAGELLRRISAADD